LHKNNLCLDRQHLLPPSALSHSFLIRSLVQGHALVFDAGAFFLIRNQKKLSMHAVHSWLWCHLKEITLI